MRRVLLLVLLTLYAAFASAQAERPEERKSYAKAYTYMALGTVVPVIVGSALTDTDGFETLGGLSVVSGLLFGPSIGRIYADDAHAFNMILFRAGGSLLFGSGLYYVLSCEVIDGCTSQGLALSIVSFSGAGAVVGSFVYDFIRTGLAVQDYNKRHARVSLTPGYDARAGTPLLGLRVDF